MSRKLFEVTLLVLAFGLFSFVSAETTETNTIKQPSVETYSPPKTNVEGGGQGGVYVKPRYIEGVEVKTSVEGEGAVKVRYYGEDYNKSNTVEGEVRVKATGEGVMNRPGNDHKVLLEAQRDKLIKDAEVRKKAFEAKKDVVGAEREEMKIKIEEKREEMDEKREVMRVEFEMKRASSTEKRVAWQQEVAKRKVEHTIRVMTATIERLEKIITRIESRITKVKANGGVTTESEGYIAEAKAELALAKTSLAALATVDLSSEKAQENFERIRNAAAEAREHIRAVREKLMLAVRALPPTEVELRATTTTSVEL